MADAEVAKVHVYLGLRSDLAKDTASEIRRFERETKNVVKVNNTMLEAGKVLTVGLSVPIALAAKQMSALASAAIETENLYNVSVGSMRAQFDKFVNDTSRGLGINRYDLMQTAGIFDVMLQSMGLTNQQAYQLSTGLTQLKYDMSSFYNIPIEEMGQKLQSALAGEVEPMRQLGITVDENTVKAYAYANGVAQQGSELTNAQKVLARYGVIMEQTSKAQGDLARTADSPANAARRASQMWAQAGADLGKVFIPAVAAGSNALAGMASALANAPTAVKGFVVGVTGVIATVGPAILLVEGLRKAMLSVAKTSPMFYASMPWIGVAALAVGAIVAVTSAVNEHNAAIARNKQMETDLSAQLEDVRTQLADGNLDQNMRNALLDQEKTVLEQLSDILPETIGQRDSEGKLIAISTEELDAYNKKIKEEEVAHNDAAIAINNQRKATLELQRAQYAALGEANARQNGGVWNAEDLGVVQDYDQQIQALSDDTAALTKRNGELAESLSGDGKTKPPPVVAGVEKTVTALDRLKRELEIVRAENALSRAELGLDSATNEQIAREYDAQAKIVAELTKQYNALAKSKGLAADATRDTYRALKQEQAALAEIKAQLEAERKAQLEAALQNGGMSSDKWNQLMSGLTSGPAYAAIEAEMISKYGNTGIAAEAARAEAYSRWANSANPGINKSGQAVINNYFIGADEAAAARGMTRSLEQAGIVGGR